MYKKLFTWLSLLILSWTLISCSDTIDSVQAFDSEEKPPLPNVEKIAEVAPPTLIQQLNQNFTYTKPQVEIITPKNDQVLDSTTAEVKLNVQGITLFKNEELQMGPHLHFFVDDQPYRAIYNAEEPIVLSDLAPGTHTIRVFASRPWHESFKNQGAYAQATFHVFTKTEKNNPSLEQPLLTYSRPQGNYGAEPIMLDFYLTNAPLHLVAQESPEDEIVDWRIRVTINGETFLLDTWQPIYLTGFNKGQNWIKLEYVNENGDVVSNAFNSTVRVINLDPKIKDTLAKLVTNKIRLAQAQVITSLNPPEITEETIIEEVEEVTPPTVTGETEEKAELIETEIIETVEPESNPEKIELAEPETSKSVEELTPIESNDQSETSSELTQNDQNDSTVNDSPTSESSLLEDNS